MKACLPKLLICILAISFIAVAGLPPAYAEETSWDALLSGIEKYSADNKLKEEFIRLCQENETALIIGRVHTGSGLYMTIDVPVYSQPDGAKISELRDGSAVILTGQKEAVGGKEWIQIKFLRISAYTEMAVDISEGWVEKAFIKPLSNEGI